MRSKKAKLVTFGAVLLGITTLVVVGFALKEPIVEKWYVAQLQRAREAKKWAIAQKLHEIGSDVAEEWYLSKLASEEKEERRRATEKLAEMGSVRAIPLLIGVLERAYSRREVLRGTTPLVRIGAPAIPSLITLLKNKDQRSNVRNGVGRALGQIGPSAIQPLIEVLRTGEHDARQYAGNALIKIGDSAIPTLVVALDDEKEDVRRWAAICLGGIGSANAGAVRALMLALKDPDQGVRKRSAMALAGITENAEEFAPAVLDALDDDEAFGRIRNELLQKVGR